MPSGLRLHLDIVRWSQMLSNLLMKLVKQGYPDGGHGKIELRTDVVPNDDV